MVRLARGAEEAGPGGTVVGEGIAVCLRRVRGIRGGSASVDHHHKSRCLLEKVVLGSAKTRLGRQGSDADWKIVSSQPQPPARLHHASNF